MLTLLLSTSKTTTAQIKQSKSRLPPTILGELEPSRSYAAIALISSEW